MNIMDIILGVVLIWGLYKGFKNGLLIEVAAILALIAGIYGAIHFSYIAGDYLSRNMQWNERYINTTAFIITFIIIVIAVHFAGKLLTKVANIVLLGAINKIAGALFGALKVAVILGAVLIFFDRLNNTLSIVSEDTKKESILYEPVKEIGAFVFSKVLKNKEDEEG
ncbi:membrane protein required for colicin V production [Saonia flava]|uniref:Membrane protein required for colicin V production n=1 Tax=Saonia flava TaxID=523696 RepID=A0A846QVL6_9FLAO|nr:CvpA family protein [Saonia flava]NJB71277.1 membrane protein required for colicin V production [Saonia flava]